MSAGSTSSETPTGWRARLAAVQARWSAFAATPTGQRVTRYGRWLVLAAIIGYLVWQFSEIGWREILTSLPTAWGFYAIFLVLYFTLPVTESLIYRLSWGTSVGRGFPAFVKKRVYNKDFVGYSGEAYLFAWARRRVTLPDTKILGIIKDNVILSGFASTLFAVSLLALFLVVGNVEALGFDRDQVALYVAAAVAVLVVLVLIGLRLRTRLFTLSARLLGLVFALHYGRLAAMNALQVVQWDLVIPGIPWQSWFVFLAVQVIISRLPFLPSRDLIFLGASVELAETLGIPRAEMAAMLVVLSALDKALNLVLFLLISALNARHPDPELSEAADAAAEDAPLSD